MQVKSKEQVLTARTGWLTEDDLTVTQRKSQGWAGMSSLPREVSPISYTGVTGSLKSPLSRLRCFEQSEQADGTFTLSAIAVRPAKELLCLRENALVSQVADLPMYPYRVAACLPLSTQTWELEIDVDLLPSCSSTTIKIQHSAGEQPVPYGHSGADLWRTRGIHSNHLLTGR